eukprot:TRINITY_DN63363_c0_g1_i1.p1 TRINITY_DN63363_c0_g1~~TRINITY_DN63363_c0_g1_i1.p1  ORF type:complete len:386 (-),score=41.09 TRINITY_DN63363_c0_g1_i1:110-1267(-)
MAKGSGAKESSVQKAKLAAMARARTNVKNSELQYLLWGGGAMGSVVLAALIAIFSNNGPSETQVNDPGLLEQLKRTVKSWRAAPCSFFQGWTLGDVRKFEGISVSAGGGAVSPCTVMDVPLPESFDARAKWPDCFQTPIYSMGNCTASWAIATASALANRVCIANPDTHPNLMLSPQHIISCDRMNHGCNGGDIDTVWNFIEREGLVSESCFPYRADGAKSCSSKCSNEEPLRATSHCVLNSELKIRREILTSGPVVAPVFLSDDFLVYKSGIYRPSAGATQIVDARRQRIIHAVKLIGWSATKSGVPYWLLENSWGEDWGEKGYARVIRGRDPEKQEGNVVESYVLAGTPLSSKFGSAFDDSSVEDPNEVEADFEQGALTGSDA